MKKLLLISMLIGTMPFSMLAQDDDLYFVPKKKSVEKSVVENNEQRLIPQQKALENRFLF